MSENEARALLSDTMIGPYCCDAASVYYRDGRFENYGYAFERGTWKLHGNTACSVFGDPEREWCRSFYKDSVGKPYFSFDGERDPTPVNPRRAPIKTETLKQMSEREVRLLLTGATLREDSWDTEEIYYRDGRFAHYSRRRVDYGHYEFKENRVCVTLDESKEENCFFLYSDQTNRLYSGGQGGRGSPVTVRSASEEDLHQRAIELTPHKK